MSISQTTGASVEAHGIRLYPLTIDDLGALEALVRRRVRKEYAALLNEDGVASAERRALQSLCREEIGAANAADPAFIPDLVESTWGVINLLHLASHRKLSVARITELVGDKDKHPIIQELLTALGELMQDDDAELDPTPAVEDDPPLTP